MTFCPKGHVVPWDVLSHGTYCRQTFFEGSFVLWTLYPVGRLSSDVLSSDDLSLDVFSLDILSWDALFAGPSSVYRK